jgi:four helix bundle protein
MRHPRFEDLPVWQAAVELVVRIMDLAEEGAFRGHDGLRDQLERAALSISNNIAEGWERGTHDELLAFLYYARGSAGETRSMLRVLHRRAERAVVPRVEFGDLIGRSLSISRQLGSWLESLKNSDDRGPRHRNDATRKLRDAARRQEAFQVYLRQVQEAARPQSPFPTDPGAQPT